MNNLPVVLPLAWTLVHFIWQGALIAMALGLVLRHVPRSMAGLRYLLSCGALVAMAGACVVTFLVQQSGGSVPLSGQGGAVISVVRAAAPAAINSSGITSAGAGTPTFSSLWSQVLVGVWLTGALVSALRFAVAVFKVRQLRRSGLSDVPDAVQTLLQELRLRMGIRRSVAIFQSRFVSVPSVMGWLKPLILLPPATLAGLTAGQLEAVLLHELAHIRRNDYLINCLQRILCCLLFYHPAAWWISEQVRQERENCCDDLAIEYGADPRAYARMLLTLEELRSVQEFMVLGVSGGVLLERIQRILGLPPASQPSGSRKRFLMILGSLMVFVLGAVSLVDEAPGSGGRYESTVRFLVRAAEDREVRAGVSGHPGGSAGYDPYHVQTLMASMMSQSVLESFADLVAKGGFGESLSGASKDRSEIVRSLKKRISIQQIRNSYVIAVSVRGGSPDESRALATLLGNLILDRETRLSHALVESRGLQELREKQARQEQLLMNARNDLNAVLKEIGMPEAELMTENHLIEKLRTFERQKAELEIRSIGLEATFEQMQKGADVTSLTASGRASTDSMILEMKKQLFDLEGEMVLKGRDLALEHPEMKGLQTQVNRVKEQIQDRIKAIREGVKSELQLAQAELRMIENRTFDLRKAAAELEAGKERVVAARKAVDFEQSRLEVLVRLIAQETQDQSIPKSRLDLIEAAMPGQKIPLFGIL